MQVGSINLLWNTRLSLEAALSRAESSFATPSAIVNLGPQAGLVGNRYLLALYQLSKRWSFTPGSMCLSLKKSKGQATDRLGTELGKQASLRLFIF